MVPRYLPFRERERERERELYLLAGGVVCMLQGRCAGRRRRRRMVVPFASELIQSQNYAIHELLHCAQSTAKYPAIFHSPNQCFPFRRYRIRCSDGPPRPAPCAWRWRGCFVRFLARHEPQDSPANRNDAPPFAAPTTFHRHGRPIIVIMGFVIAITYIIIKAIEGLRKRSGSKWCCLANLSPTQCGWIPTQQRIQPL
jgi:hypothetical protein